MADLKISQFADGGLVQTGDEIATNRAGINTKVAVGTAAAADTGTGPDDVPLNSDLGEAAYLGAGSAIGEVLVIVDDGSSNPALPILSGENLTDLPTSLKVSNNDTTAGYLNGKLINGIETTLTENSDGGNETLTVDIRANKATDDAPASGTNTVVYADGIWQKITPTGNFTMAFTFSSGLVQAMTIQAINFGAYTVTWPGTMKWAGGTVPTFTSSGTDLLSIVHDADNVVYGALIGKDFKTP